MSEALLKHIVIDLSGFIDYSSLLHYVEECTEMPGPIVVLLLFRYLPVASFLGSCCGFEPLANVLCLTGSSGFVVDVNKLVVQ